MEAQKAGPPPQAGPGGVIVPPTASAQEGCLVRFLAMLCVFITAKQWKSSCGDVPPGCLQDSGLGQLGRSETPVIRCSSEAGPCWPCSFHAGDSVMAAVATELTSAAACPGRSIPACGFKVKLLGGGR